MFLRISFNTVKKNQKISPVKELTASISDRKYLQQVGGTQHALNIVLGDRDLSSVRIVQQSWDMIGHITGMLSSDWSVQ